MVGHTVIFQVASLNEVDGLVKHNDLLVYIVTFV